MAYVATNPDQTVRATRLNQVLAALRAGEHLHLQLASRSSLWGLSDGQDVASDVATAILVHACIEPVGCASPGLPVQEWRLAQ